MAPTSQNEAFILVISRDIDFPQAHYSSAIHFDSSFVLDIGYLKGVYWPDDPSCTSDNVAEPQPQPPPRFSPFISHLLELAISIQTEHRLGSSDRAYETSSVRATLG